MRKTIPSDMFEEVLNMPAFSFHLTVLGHQNKRPMVYFDFLYSTGYIAFLWISQNNCFDNISSKNQKMQGIIVSAPIFYSHISFVFGYVLIHSFDKIDVLVITVELIWLLLLNILSFNFVPTPNKFFLGWQDIEEAL